MHTRITPLTRWLVATSAVGIHGSIGAIYAYSVYTKPVMEALSWRYQQVTFAFSLAIACLGLSAAFLGRFVGGWGPRKSGMLAATGYGGGLLLAGLAIRLRSPELFYFGYGILGGVGLGIGYITPVATLVKWFPDRRGLATGLAIMGFGFGALLAGPVAVRLIAAIGLENTFYVFGVGYFGVMMISAFILAAPPEGWRPAGWEPATMTSTSSSAVHPVARDYTPREALLTPRFTLLWLLFFIQVTCGIAVISAASPMAQEIAKLTTTQAAAMIGLMGLFNGLGRIGWSSASDLIGRPATFLAFCIVQGVAFFVLPSISHPLLFQATVFLIISCYGGGFATMPAYLSDLFGTKSLAVIYGYMLTAWSAAGIAGPMLTASIRAHTGGFEGTLRYGAVGFAVALVLAVLVRLDQKRAA